MNPMWTSKSISEPVNIPNPLNQEDARYLEQYLKNDFKNPGDNPLNLGLINHRTNKPVARKMAEPNLSSPRQDVGVRPTGHDSSMQRADFGYPASGNLQEGMFGRKGKVDDVLLAKQTTRGGGYAHPGNLKQNLVQTIFHSPVLNKFQENCITKSAQQAGVCEDHLIKRLTQDATEGRTVVDVGRRVCCALFWHKECIDSIVLKSCPDSTPVAADYILGARKIDLATSCQRFNREGCNGSSKMSTVISKVLPIVVSIFVLFFC